MIAESTDLPDDAELVAALQSDCPERVYASTEAGPIIRVAFVPPLSDEPPHVTIFIATDVPDVPDVPDEATGC